MFIESESALPIPEDAPPAGIIIVTNSRLLSPVADALGIALCIPSASRYRVNNQRNSDQSCCLTLRFQQLIDQKQISQQRAQVI
jgi:hypothetical protein